MARKDSPIGIIDSGIGGFSAVRQLQAYLPNENLLYFGDGANTPYGNHGADKILHLTRYMLTFMREREVKILLVACNTISCLIAEYQDELDCPVLSIVQAGADAVSALDVQKVGVFSTCFTHQTRCYPDLIQKTDPRKTVFSHGCPNLAALIERNLGNPAAEQEIDAELQSDLHELVHEHHVDCCVMGCTHFPLVSDNIRRLFPQMPLVDPAEQIVKTAMNYLTEQNLLNDQKVPGQLNIYTTGSVDEYQMKAEKVGLNPIASINTYPALDPNQ